MEEKYIKSPATRTRKTTENDDPITTSTDSEIFGTWTLVKDKTKASTDMDKLNEAAKPIKEETTVDAAVNRLEELKRDEQQDSEEDKEHESCKPDSSLDEVSDGISVISESDSTGRISPHPLLREHLTDFGLKMTTDTGYDLPKMAQATLDATGSLTTREDSQVKQRRRKRSSSTHALQRAEPVNTLAEPLPTRIPPIVRKGLTGLFYVGCLLGIVAIVARLRNPEWGPSGASKQLDDLEQKLNDMELHNNLMRAEIDILTKQVNYLNTLREQQQSGGYKADFARPSAPYQQDYKAKSYQREEQQNERFAKNEAANAKESYNKQMPTESIEANPELSEAMRNIGKIHDNLKQTLGQVEDKLNDQKQNESKQNESQTNAGHKGERKYERKMERMFNKDYVHQSSKMQRDSKEKFGDKSAWAQKKFKAHREHSHDRDHDRDDDDDDHDDDDDDDDSHERFDKSNFKKPRNGDNSKEHFNKQPQQQHGHFKDNSKEFHHDKRFKADSDERHKKSSEYFGGDKKDGQWQEQYMNHRANERRSHEKQRNDKNWFIERGDSREHKRYVDHRYR